jgi:alpha-glucuronidase
MKKLLLVACSCLVAVFLYAEDGYRLWLGYDKIDDPVLLQQYRNSITGIQFSASSPTLSVASRNW